MAIIETTVSRNPQEYRKYLERKTKDDLIWMILDLEKELSRELERTAPRAAFGFEIIVDPSIPNDTMKLKDKSGRVLGTIVVPEQA